MYAESCHHDKLIVIRKWLLNNNVLINSSKTIVSNIYGLKYDSL